MTSIDSSQLMFLFLLYKSAPNDLEEDCLLKKLLFIVYCCYFSLVLQFSILYKRERDFFTRFFSTTLKEKLFRREDFKPQVRVKPSGPSQC